MTRAPQVHANGASSAVHSDWRQSIESLGLTVTVVMPALNEEQGVASAIKSVPVEALSRLGCGTELIVVDNGSTDRTGEIALAHGARVVEERRRGYGYACRAGMAAARGEVICVIDADCSYPAEVIPDLLCRLVTLDADFVSTNRLGDGSPGMSRVSRLGNRFLSRATRVLFRLPIQDSQSGMWVVRRRLLERLRLESGGMSLSQEIKIKAARAAPHGFLEVPISYRVRAGRSKLNVWRDGTQNLTYLFRMRFR